MKFEALLNKVIKINIKSRSNLVNKKNILMIKNWIIEMSKEKNINN